MKQSNTNLDKRSEKWLQIFMHFVEATHLFLYDKILIFVLIKFLHLFQSFCINFSNIQWNSCETTVLWYDEDLNLCIHIWVSSLVFITNTKLFENNFRFYSPNSWANQWFNYVTVSLFAYMYHILNSKDLFSYQQAKQRLSLFIAIKFKKKKRL